MKFCLTLYLFFFAATALTQDSSIARSRFEEFSSQPGKTLKTEIRSVGSLRGMRVYRMRTTDLASGASVHAVGLFSGFFSDNLDPLPKVGRLFVDPEDTASLLHSLQTFSDEIRKGNHSLTDFTLSYTTANDVRFFMKYEHTSVSPWDLAVGQQFRYLRSMVPGSVTTINRREIDSLIFLIRTAAKGFDEVESQK